MIIKEIIKCHNFKTRFFIFLLFSRFIGIYGWVLYGVIKKGYREILGEGGGKVDKWIGNQSLIVKLFYYRERILYSA